MADRDIQRVVKLLRGKAIDSKSAQALNEAFAALIAARVRGALEDLAAEAGEGLTADEVSVDIEEGGMVEAALSMNLPAGDRIGLNCDPAITLFVNEAMLDVDGRLVAIDAVRRRGLLG
jgi:hypothetical protein